ncbi:MAG TPA: thiolase family protein, partial [Candidatus Eisenbacteria bacterium]|nr:thiolase family protein [Candidatus Eisenbacteria bacterium]
DVRAAYLGNAAWGLMSGQESVRGQVVLRRTGLMGVPIVNVENACASSSTALHLAWHAVAGGLHDCVVVLGYEKLDHGDRARKGLAINATMDLGEVADVFGPGAGQERNVYVDVLAASTAGEGRDPFSRELLAQVAVKNHHHGSLNPCAMRRAAVTVEEVLDAPAVAGQLTRLMCAPLVDGAACLVLCADGFVRGRRTGVRIAASVLASGRGDDMRQQFSIGLAARQAYDLAGIGPKDLDLVELYDPTPISELYLYEELGLCDRGEAPRLVRERATWLGGRQPVNTSGGLIARGHPLGATGAAQVVELAWQLEGRCGARQVPGARLAMAHNTGGWVGSDVAACCIHVLQV